MSPGLYRLCVSDRKLVTVVRVLATFRDMVGDRTRCVALFHGTSAYGTPTSDLQVEEDWTLVDSDWVKVL